jgi:hypothetical protein
LPFPVGYSAPDRGPFPRGDAFMNTHVRALFPLLLTAALLAACSKATNTSTDREGKGTSVDSPSAAIGSVAGNGLSDLKSSDGTAMPIARANKKTAPAVAEAPAPGKDQSEEQPNESAQKAKEDKRGQTGGLYIIRHATLALQVPSVKESQQRIAKLVIAQQGFVSDSRLESAEGGVPSASLTVRVPADKFDALLNQLGDVGAVRARQVSGEDVTMDYVDTGSRIRNLQKEETQLVLLLQRAGKLTDVLQVERELARVRGEIEQAQGRLRHLASMVDLATIEITLAEKIEVQTTSPWQVDVSFQNAWRNAQRQLASSLSNLVAEAVDFTVAVLPLLLLSLLAFILVGGILRAILVDRLKLVGALMFKRGWLAIGFVLLASVYPPLFSLLALALLAVGVAWAGTALFGRLFKRRSID